ncbi:hypothetical protein WICPIJ_003438, partial [Wickerhamomyces pijperi]
QQYLQQQEYVQQLQQQQQQIQIQPTGMSKNQLMSLYSTGSTQQINQQFQQQVPTFQNTTTGQFQQPQFTQQFQQQQPQLQQPQFTGFQPPPPPPPPPPPQQQQTYRQQFNPQQGFNGF